MKTPSLPEKVTAPTDPMAALSSLITTLGGTKTTTNAGNTEVLNSAVEGMKGINYEGLLQSIFQKAAGEIPGIQRALGNAVGARSGGNSAVSAALQKLLQQTTVGAQGEIAQQQLANLNSQANAGASIAQATKGTTQQQGANTGKAAKALTLLSLLSKTGLDKKLSGLFGDSSSAAAGVSPLTSAYAPVASPWATQSDGGDITSASLATPMPQLFSGMAFGATGTSGAGEAPTLSAEDSAAFDALTSTWDSSPVDMSGFFTPSAPIEYTPSFEIPSSYIPVEEFNFDFSVPELDWSFADGGRVTAATSRRSANPSIVLTEPGKTGANNSTPAPVASAPASAPAPRSPARPPMILTEEFSNDGAGTGGTQGNAAAGTAATAATAGQVAGAMLGMLGLGPIGTAVSAATSQNPTATAVNGVLGTVTNGLTSVANLGFNAIGMNSIGQTVSGLMSPSVDLSLSQATDPANNAVAASGVVGSPVAGPGAVDVTDLGMLGLDAPAEGAGSASGDDGSGGSGTSGAGMGGDGPGGGWKDGGPVNGKGTGTSDSININVSDGEYIVPDDVVEHLGESFFDRLLAAFHTPVAQRRSA